MWSLPRFQSPRPFDRRRDRISIPRISPHADPRRRSLPVVFLTGRTEPESVYRVFAAGADDFVAKPFVGPELIARIRNGLERVRR